MKKELYSSFSFRDGRRKGAGNVSFPWRKHQNRGVLENGYVLAGLARNKEEKFYFSLLF
jgi:hypothetical protein